MASQQQVFLTELISILALEGAWHRDDRAVPHPRMENRPKWSLPRNPVSSPGLAHLLFWAASLNMCLLHDLLLQSSKA